jgi:hypothetical protein
MHGTGQLAVTAAVSAVVSATLTYLLVAKGLERNSAEADATLAELSAEVSRLGRQVARQSQPTGPLQAKTAQGGRAPDSNLDAAALDERLTAIEDALAALESGREAQAQSSLQDFATRVTPYTASPTSGDGYRPNTAGEALFESAADSGDGDSHASAIEEVFHNTELGVSLDEVYCKDTVCKITYREAGQGAPGSFNQGAQIQLLDQISATRPNADLDVYYGRTERGDTVMYLQIE